MHSSKFNIAQVSFIKPILDELEASGFNPRDIYKSTGLSRYNISDINNYIPVPILYKVLNRICKKENIRNLSATFNDVIKVTSLSSWGEMIAYAPDVYSACKLAEKHGDTILSNERIGLDINGHISTYWQKFTDEYQEGKEQMEYISLSLALNGFRLAGGQKWAPLELHFQSDSVDDLSHLLPENSNTKVYFNQPRSAIVFPTNMLMMPMLQHEKSVPKQYEHSNFSSLKSKVLKLLDANQKQMLPNLQVIADQFGVSPRTFQRYLSSEDNTFSSIIDDWRLMKAIEMIEDPSYKIIDIAQRTGYANAPNFNRSFYRWTGTSPKKYREQLM